MRIDYSAAIRGAVAGAILPALAGASLLAAGLTVTVMAAPSADRAVLAGLVWLTLVGVAGLWLSRGIAASVSAPAQSLLADAMRGGAMEAAGYEPTAHSRRNLSGLKSDLEALAASLARRSEAGADTIAELVRVKEHAQSTNYAKSQFLAGMSHELRTPLNAIVGYATLLHEDAVADCRSEQEADLARILEASRRLIELISDVLDLSNMETGKLVFQPGIVNVETLVTGATAGLLAHRGGNRFNVEIDPKIGIMVGDEAKIRRCLANLVSNAFKFTRNGDVDLRVSLRADGAAEQIVFAVTDTGIGMTEDRIAVVFEPMAQAEAGTTRANAGSGLGLAVTRRLARMMDGDVTAVSVPGEGSTFTITLPRQPARIAANAPVLVDDAAADDAETFDKLALVIDDDQTAVALMRRRLAQYGYGVIAAADGDTGLALARSEQPDIIVLDIFMPGMNGYEVLEELRADDAIRGTPVIVATVDDDRLRGLASGATDYLTKPVGPEQLADVLNLYRDAVDGEVLIVDDDEDAGDLIARTVAQVGLRSRRAYDGLQALTMIREAPPSAVVLDLTMPGMSGFAVVEALRSNLAYREIPIIVVSGRALTLAEHEAIVDAGCTFYTKGESSPRQIAQSLKLALAA